MMHQHKLELWQQQTDACPNQGRDEEAVNEDETLLGPLDAEEFAELLEFVDDGFDEELPF